MAKTLETLVVKLAGDAAGYNQMMDQAGGRVDAFAGKAKAAGGKLTRNVTAPLLGIVAASTAMATQVNKDMANVASLGVDPARVKELKAEVQDLAITYGKSTGDMAGGLYQVVSAYGDTSDSAEILRINAEAAAAGLATTEDSIALTSAVTKGYGDTSAEAVQKAADLAFQTVKLGQTTFPELANSMGKVIPLAATLGVTQEELYAQMATLTGVTGDASRVSTQLQASYQSLLKPSDEMAVAISGLAVDLEHQGKLVDGPLTDAWRNARARYKESMNAMSATSWQLKNLDKSTEAGAKSAKELEKTLKQQEKAHEDNADAVKASAAALGPAIVDSVGYSDTLQMLADSAGGNTDQLGAMFGSVEALNAVLALSGSQAEVYNDKLAAMSDVSGAASDAFEAQSEGINATGFTMQQAAIKAQVLMQKLGDGLAPALGKLLDLAAPWIDKLIEMADRFANADSSTQTWIVGIGAALAAAGPFLMIIGTIISVVSALAPLVGVLGAALAILTGPIGLVVAAVALLALAWTKDFLGIKTKTLKTIDTIKTKWPGFVDGLKTKSENAWKGIKGAWEIGGKALGTAAKFYMDANLFIFKNALNLIKSLFDLFGWSDIGANIINGIVEGIRGQFDTLRAVAQAAANIFPEWLRKKLGMASPSRVMAEQVGKPMAEGIGAGFERALSGLNSQMNAQMGGLTGGMSAAGAGAGAGAQYVITVNLANGGYEAGREAGRGLVYEMRSKGMG